MHTATNNMLYCRIDVIGVYLTKSTFLRGFNHGVILNPRQKHTWRSYNNPGKLFLNFRPQNASLNYDMRQTANSMMLLCFTV